MNKTKFLAGSFLLFAGIVILISFFLIQNSNQIKDINFDEKSGQSTCNYRGQTRKFILCLPENFESKSEQEKSGISLVVMLHGYGSNSIFFKNQTRFEKDALPQNYAVLYLTGTTNPNIPSSDTGWHYNENALSTNDINFIKQITRTLQKEYGLNQKAFALGFSNGAFLLNKIAVSNPEIFAAVVSVGGMMPESAWKNRPEKSDCGFLQINGTLDDVVPMLMNNSNQNKYDPPVENVLEYFSEAEDFSHNKTEILSERVTIQHYDSKTAWILIKDGKHQWPSENFTKININQEILRFFNNFKE